MNKRIGILVIDEAVLDRDAMRSALEGAPDVEILGLAPTGKTGLARLQQVEPELLLLSGGLLDMTADEVTRQALAHNPRLGVLLLTGDDANHAPGVVAALKAGALDVMVKPNAATAGELEEVMRRRLLPKIRSLSTALYSRLARDLFGSSQPGALAGGSAERAAAVMPPTRQQRLNVDVVLIGLSTGGSEALSRLVPRLSGALPVPVVIVLHMPEHFTGSLARDLDRKAALTVQEAREGDELRPGTVYLAPGGKHLEMERGTRRRLILHLSDAPPVGGCRPSVDLLFRSAATACPGGALCLIMTGMGADGVDGLRAIKERGKGHVLAQDEATSVIWGMPGSAVRAGVVDEVLPLSRLAGRVGELLGV